LLDWLFDARLSVYIVLGGVGLLLTLAWWRTRKQVYLKRLILPIGLAAIYALISHFVETPKQEITRKLKEMADGVMHNELDKAFAHISEDFRVGGSNKNGFRKRAEELKSAFGVTEMIVWDIDVTELDEDKGRASATLAVKTLGSYRGSGSLYFNGRAEFQRDTDGQWRLLSFQLFHPFIDTSSPLPLPL
jgi:hypothetical protein